MLIIIAACCHSTCCQYGACNFQQVLLVHRRQRDLSDCDEYVQLTNQVELTWLIIVLHPRYKTFYFLTVGWEQTWIDEAL
jgi:hypothetical protein